MKAEGESGGRQGLMKMKRNALQGFVLASNGYVRAKEKGSQLFGYPLCHHPSGKSE